uniref:Uncharacterized protein n=1 Tax=Salix viminalis TaxID=40686 RepID=A0A6N2NA12_SALVM
MSTTATTVRTAAAMRPSPSASATTTTLENPTQQQTQTLTLRLNRPKKRVSWKEGTVDNEFMQKKSSKICCIFHKEKPFDEDDSDDDDCNHDHHEHKSDGACSSSQKNCVIGGVNSILLPTSSTIYLQDIDVYSSSVIGDDGYEFMLLRLLKLGVRNILGGTSEFRMLLGVFLAGRH